MQRQRTNNWLQLRVCIGGLKTTRQSLSAALVRDFHSPASNLRVQFIREKHASVRTKHFIVQLFCSSISRYQHTHTQTDTPDATLQCTCDVKFPFFLPRLLSSFPSTPFLPLPRCFFVINRGGFRHVRPNRSPHKMGPHKRTNFFPFLQHDDKPEQQQQRPFNGL